MTSLISKPHPASFSEDLVNAVNSRINIKGKKKISFYAISPPLVPEKPFDIEVAKRCGYYNFPPTGSMYLCASIDSLKLKNVSTEVIDLNNNLLKYAIESKEFKYCMWKNKLKNLYKCDSILVFLVSYMFGTTKECYINTVNFIRSIYKDSLIITGGVQATFDKKEILTTSVADIVCLHEGELQIQYITNLLHSMIKQSSTKNIIDTRNIPGGICLVSDAGNEINSGEDSQPIDLEWDLSKYYKQIQIQDYYKYGGLGPFSKLVENHAGKKLPYSAVLTKRGCRAHCAFCTVRSFNGKGLRLRTVDSVIKEIDYLYSNGVRHIDWLDDDLLYNEVFNLELFTKIAIQFPDLIWTASNGLIGVAITEKLMKSMSESGLVAFKIGVESGSSQIIKEIRKPTTLWKLLDKAELIRMYPHIFFSANFIVGFPGETFSQMMDSFSFARRLSCDWASFYVCQPLKGTDLFSSFQHLMDPRAKEENYRKTINPGRSAARGEFAYTEQQQTIKSLEAGWGIFKMEDKRIFDATEHNEIWFTFNLVANFLDNPCYKSEKATKKLINWLLAIQAAYPYDASMTAALSHSYKLIGRRDLSEDFKHKTEKIILDSLYWQKRVRSFPELLTLADITAKDSSARLLNIDPPKKLVPNNTMKILNQIHDRREKNGWRD